MPSCPKGLTVTFYPYSYHIEKCDKDEYKEDCYKLITNCIKCFVDNVKELDGNNIHLKEFYPNVNPITYKHKKCDMNA